MDHSFRTTLLGLVLCTLAIPAAHAADEKAPQDTEMPTTEVADASRQAKTYEVIRPCLGSGYVPYTYPPIDSCPCGSDCCFHPHKYYFGGKSYRVRWFHKWLRAKCPHSSHSMLHDYPCKCIFPKYGRPYWRVPEAATDASGHTEIDVEAQQP